MRLLSYNIHKGIGGRDRRYRLERIISVIEAENPDIICLQEVDRHCRRSSHDDQPKLLVEYFKLDSHLYQANVSLKFGMYGNLILSRWPFLYKHQISLRLNRRKPRPRRWPLLIAPKVRFNWSTFTWGWRRKNAIGSSTICLAITYSKSPIICRF